MKHECHVTLFCLQKHNLLRAPHHLHHTAIGHSLVLTVSTVSSRGMSYRSMMYRTPTVSPPPATVPVAPGRAVRKLQLVVQPVVLLRETACDID